mgnify:CR=1 FL=1
MALEPNDRIYAIGDIHGRLDLLDRLYRLIRADGENEPPGRRTVVHLGDYVDRGPESRGVIERVMAPSLPGFESITLMGNHDFMMRGFLGQPAEVGQLPDRRDHDVALHDELAARDRHRPAAP